MRVVVGIDYWSFKSLFMSDLFPNWIRDNLDRLVVDWSRSIIDVAGGSVRLVAFSVGFAAESNFGDWGGMIDISDLSILAASDGSLLNVKTVGCEITVIISSVVSGGFVVVSTAYYVSLGRSV